MTAWEEYVAAARRLDAVRRAAAASAAEEAATAQSAREELAVVRTRLTAQRGRLAEVAGQAGLRPPDVAAEPAQVDTATAALKESGAANIPAATLGALHQARSHLDAADAELTATEQARSVWAQIRGWPPAVRNLLVYGPLALGVLILQLGLFAAASGMPQRVWPMLCGFVLPVLAFGVGWLTIGLLFSGGPGRVERTPTVGAVVCLAPLLLACTGFTTLVILR